MPETLARDGGCRTNPRWPHWIRSEGGIENPEGPLLVRGALFSASAVPAPSTGVTASAAQLLVHGFMRHPRRAGALSAPTRDTSALRRVSRRLPIVGRCCRGSSKGATSSSALRARCSLVARASRVSADVDPTICPKVEPPRPPQRGPGLWPLGGVATGFSGCSMRWSVTSAKPSGSLCGLA